MGGKRGPNLTAEQKITIRMMYHDQGETPEDIGWCGGIDPTKRVGESKDLHFDLRVGLCGRMHAVAVEPGLCGGPSKCSCHEGWTPSPYGRARVVLPAMWPPAHHRAAGHRGGVGSPALLRRGAPGASS